MAIDHKYGRVTLEHGTIGEDEPVVVFRAQDTLLSRVLAYYIMFCLQVGSPRHHIDSIQEARDKVISWQKANPDLVRVPNSNAFVKRIGRDKG
jgi:hypothetical protein